MKFRKNSLLFYQSEFLYIFMAVLCLAVIPIFKSFMFLGGTFLFALLAVINTKLYNEFIVINEIGISCQRSGDQLWSYEWDMVADLKRSTRFLLPSIEVIVYDKSGTPKCFAENDHYFHLGKTAKNAVNKYYKKTGDSSQP